MELRKTQSEIILYKISLMVKRDVYRNGVFPRDVAKATGIKMPSVRRCIATLVSKEMLYVSSEGRSGKKYNISSDMPKWMGNNDS